MGCICDITPTALDWAFVVLYRKRAAPLVDRLVLAGQDISISILSVGPCEVSPNSLRSDTLIKIRADS